MRLCSPIFAKQIWIVSATQLDSHRVRGPQVHSYHTWHTGSNNNTMSFCNEVAMHEWTLTKLFTLLVWQYLKLWAWFAQITILAVEKRPGHVLFWGGSYFALLPHPIGDQRSRHCCNWGGTEKVSKVCWIGYKLALCACGHWTTGVIAPRALQIPTWS